MKWRQTTQRWIESATGTWLPPQYVKRRVLKFRLATFAAPQKGPLKSDFCSMEQQGVP